MVENSMVEEAMDHVPRLSVGLPVYNGETYLPEALDALLGQSYPDFELIISDNASTDSTRNIVEAYAVRDARIRYFRHERNRGSTYNHNFCITSARGEFFKWVSDDDLYHPSLLERCVEALDERPDIVLAHAWTAYMDDSGVITDRLDYPLTTDVQDPVKRFVSLLYTQGGDDIYGIIRMSVLRRVRLFGSYHLADRTFVAELALHGPFFNVPEFYYFRRDHPGRTSRSGGNIRPRCVRLDPRRANVWRHPMARLIGEYLLGFVSAIHRSPISRRDRRSCYRELMLWILAHANPKYRLELLKSPDPAFRAIGTNSRVARAEATFRRFRNRLTQRGTQARGMS
jgi:glycosyltransferase involved in cell wall biosynthesis